MNTGMRDMILRRCLHNPMVGLDIILNWARVECPCVSIGDFDATMREMIDDGRLKVATGTGLFFVPPDPPLRGQCEGVIAGCGREVNYDVAGKHSVDVCVHRANGAPLALSRLIAFHCSAEIYERVLGSMIGHPVAIRYTARALPFDGATVDEIVEIPTKIRGECEGVIVGFESLPALFVVEIDTPDAEAKKRQIKMRANSGWVGAALSEFFATGRRCRVKFTSHGPGVFDGACVDEIHVIPEVPPTPKVHKCRGVVYGVTGYGFRPGMPRGSMLSVTVKDDSGEAFNLNFRTDTGWYAPLANSCGLAMEFEHDGKNLLSFKATA